MSTECKICEGTGNEPGELGCVWCDETGKAGGLNPAPSGELEAFRAYMAANPMATYWSTWLERAKLSTAELEQSQARRRQFAEEVNGRLTTLDERTDALEQRNAELVAQSQQLKRLLGDAKANLNPTGRLAKAIDAALYQKSEGEIPDFSPGNGNKARRRAEALRQPCQQPQAHPARCGCEEQP